MTISFWETIISVAAGASLTFLATIISDNLRNRREERAFNRRKKMEAYLEVFEILNDYLAHSDAMKTNPSVYCEQLTKINKMNVLTGIFASKRFERAITEYSALGQKDPIPRGGRERFLNVMRSDLGLPLLERHTKWQRISGLLRCRFRRCIGKGKVFWR